MLPSGQGGDPSTAGTIKTRSLELKIVMGKALTQELTVWVSGMLWKSSVSRGPHTQVALERRESWYPPTPGHSCPADLVGGGSPTVAAAPHTATETSPPVPWQ